MLFVCSLLGVQSQAFPADSIHPTDSFQHPFVAGYERFAVHGDISPEQAGTLLVTELSCVACHEDASAALAPKRGPVLNSVAKRINADWLRQFLSAPHSVKPGTTMPNVLNGLEQSERKEAIEALVAFLSTQDSPLPKLVANAKFPIPLEFWKKGERTKGSELYHSVGCVACHAATAKADATPTDSAFEKLLEELEPEELEELGLSNSARAVPSQPLGDLNIKYSAKSLTYFLLKPHSVRPAGRMPDFQLQPMEAAHIAAHLHAGERTEIGGIQASPQLIEKGAALFVSLQCANCHATKEKIGGLTTASTKLKDLKFQSGNECINTSTDSRFSLSPKQLADVQSILQSSGPSDSTASDDIQLGLMRMNCYGCHERGSLGGVGRFRRGHFETKNQVDLGDEGRLPPALDHVGFKLKPAWLKKVVLGGAAIRPHMQIRMPKFPSAIADNLSKNLALADTATADNVQVPTTDVPAKQLISDGRRLMDLGCVQCHSFAGETLPGVVGVDLSKLSTRLNPVWFHAFLRNPVHLKKRTRMPTFFPDGKSQSPEILDGNIPDQIHAMWSYLNGATKESAPAKILEARSKSYELKPEDKPIILRTFMEHAGTHAIAVGSPEKVHFAFNSDTVNLATIWRGRFLDAEGTWFVRFAPLASPLGDEVLHLPIGPSFALLEDATQPWSNDGSSMTFRGYRLDEAGYPTFHYSIASYQIEEKITPNPNGLLREFSIRSQSGKESSEDLSKNQLFLRVHEAEFLKLSKSSRSVWTDELTIRILESPTIGNVIAHGNGKRHILPLGTPKSVRIRWVYEW